MNTVEKLLKMDAGKLKMPEKNIPMKLAKFDNEEFIFPCKAIDPEIMSEIQEDAVEMKKSDISKIKIYNMKIRTIIEGCPIFKDKELMEHFNAPTPKELIKKLLISGEIDELYNKISELNGYEKDEEDIKN
jgi:hypothetical protein